LTASMLKEGTTTLTSEQLAAKAGGMGGALSIDSTPDRTMVGIDVLSEFGPEAVRLVADVLEHPRLPESELPRLKNDELREIALDASRPQTIAAIRFRKILYGDHPYAIVLPTEENVKKITLDDIKQYFGANFCAQRSHIYVAGRFDKAAVKSAIEESFKGWTKEASARTAKAPSPTPQRVLDVTDRPAAPQSTLLVGLPVIPPNHPDAIPLIVTDALLGGAFNSRITSNIREQKGYTYSPYSFISSRYHDSFWAESADVTTQFTGPSLKEIFGEINRLSAEPPPAQELKGIQNYLSGVFVIRNSDRGALISQLQNVDFQGLGDSYLRTYIANVNAVTPEVVQKITQQYIRPASMTIVVVGDKSKISDQIMPYEPGKSF
jgi:zinc protease